LEYLGGYFPWSVSLSVLRLTIWHNKSILTKGTEKVNPCILGQAFSVCFLLIFILWKWQLHQKNTFLQVYLASHIPRWNVLPYYSTKRFYSLQK
jgi:hypothetical protein